MLVRDPCERTQPATCPACEHNAFHISPSFLRTNSSSAFVCSGDRIINNQQEGSQAVPFAFGNVLGRALLTCLERLLGDMKRTDCRSTMPHQWTALALR